MAPELFSGARGDERSEVFALGVTLYRMFSGGAYPYGEIEPFSKPRFSRYQSLVRHRPDLPAWLDALIGRAVAVSPADRFDDAMELGFALENHLARGGSPTRLRKRSLYERNPLLFWQTVSLLLFCAFVATLALK
jgi:serine/threonine protein kinase